MGRGENGEVRIAWWVWKEEEDGGRGEGREAGRTVEGRTKAGESRVAVADCLARSLMV